MPIPDHLRQHHIFAGGSWGAMSGEKPMHKPVVPATHENLVKMLHGMGLKFDETHGKYEQPERSVIIYNPSHDQMMHLGKMFGQDSVVHSSGGQHRLLYTNGPHEGKVRGTALEGNPIDFFSSPPDDYYTHLPGHGYFRVNFDWNQEPKDQNPVVLKKPLAPGKEIHVSQMGAPRLNKSTSPIMKRAKLAKAAPPHPLDPEGKQVLSDGIQQQLPNYKVAASPKPKGMKMPNRAAPYTGVIPAHENMDGVRAAIRPGWDANIDESRRFDRAHGIPGAQAGSFYSGDLEPKIDESRTDMADPFSYWQTAGAQHPNNYPWHDDNLPDWTREDALAQARRHGLIKANEQAAPVGVSSYVKYAAPYGQVTPGQQSSLDHYPYHGKLPEIENLVRNHGYKVYYAGGKYGKPDLVNKNYNTGHLMIYDPTPGSGGDFKQEEYTKGWRQIHELAHALTYPELNSIYGEGRRMGKLGIHRNLNEAMRAVHWEWLAAHKQRELGEKIGIKIPDHVFHKELNTVMHDAVHRAVTGKFTEPAGEGFTPHEHKVPLSHAMDVLRDEAQGMGLQHRHQTLKAPQIAKHEKRQELLAKAFPTRQQSEEQEQIHRVLGDAIEEKGPTQPSEMDVARELHSKEDQVHRRRGAPGRIMDVHQRNADQREQGETAYPAYSTSIYQGGFVPKQTLRTTAYGRNVGSVDGMRARALVNERNFWQQTDQMSQRDPATQPPQNQQAYHPNSVHEMRERAKQMKLPAALKRRLKKP